MQLQRLLSYTRKAVDEYEMIPEASPAEKTASLFSMRFTA